MIEKIIKEVVKKTTKETSGKAFSNDLKGKIESKFRDKNYEGKDSKEEKEKVEKQENQNADKIDDNPVDLLRKKADELRGQLSESDEKASDTGETKNEDSNLDKKISGCPIDGHGGKWEGERGNSKWCPDRDVIPNKQGTNPENKTWGEILDENGIDGVDFKDGEPDFSEIAKDEVEIDDFTDDRDSNFAQADEKLAEKWGVSPREIKAYREENGYTWHECGDCKTLQLVPREVHGNISHKGGISAIKAQNKMEV